MRYCYDFSVNCSKALLGPWPERGLPHSALGVLVGLADSQYRVWVYFYRKRFFLASAGSALGADFHDLCGRRPTPTEH